MARAATIDDMIHPCRRPVVYCTNRKCRRQRLDCDTPNGTPVDLAKIDPDWTVRRFVAALTFIHCGGRSLQVKWIERDTPSVYRTEARDKARAERA